MSSFNNCYKKKLHENIIWEHEIFFSPHLCVRCESNIKHYFKETCNMFKVTAEQKNKTHWTWSGTYWHTWRSLSTIGGCDVTHCEVSVVTSARWGGSTTSHECAWDARPHKDYIGLELGSAQDFQSLRKCKITYIVINLCLITFFMLLVVLSFKTIAIKTIVNMTDVLHWNFHVGYATAMRHHHSLHL